MLTRIQLTALVGLAAAIWAAVLFVQGQPLRVALLNPFSIVVSILVGALWLHDKYLWKRWPFHSLFSDVAVVEGTWDGTLQSNRIDPSTGQRAQSKAVQLVVTQQSSTVHLRLCTDEGESITMAATERADADGAKQLLGIYLYKPKHSHRGIGKNEIHHGGVILRVQGTPAERLEGHFFTDKQPPSSGNLVFERKVVNKKNKGT